MHIVITGASSGLGAALALHYARPGNRLGLLGRDEDRLKATALQAEAAGARAQPLLADVTDREAMQEALYRLDDSAPIDLLIASAGISAGTGGTEGETEEQARRIFAINVDGVLNTVHPILPRMLERKAGQVALISSLAGLRGLPSCPAYSASKAAVRFYGEGLRGACAKAGVKVNVVCPGYIATPMTERNTFYMPFLMKAETAAARIAEGLEKNRSRIAFPRRLYWPLWWLACLSPALTDPLFAALPKKPSTN